MLYFSHLEDILTYKKIDSLSLSICNYTKDKIFNFTERTRSFIKFSQSTIRSFLLPINFSTAKIEFLSRTVVHIYEHIADLK